jgi:hypothetical protein
MNKKETLQSRLIKSLEAIAPDNDINLKKVKNCITALKAVHIPEKDHANILAFIDLLIKEIPVASDNNKPLDALFEFCKSKLAADEKPSTRNKLTKRH